MISKSKFSTAMVMACLAVTATSTNVMAEQAPPAWPVNVPAVPTKFDWLLLKNGELLAGDLISMYQDKVEFDSDEFGIVTIKMKKIAQIRSRSIMSIRLDNDEVHEGQLLITEDSVSFINKPKVNIPRNTLLTIAASAKSGESLWDGSISFGMNFKSGNSERFDYTAQAHASRLTATSRMTFNYTGIFAEVEDPDSGDTVKTEENHRFNGAYDWYYSRDFFFRLPSVEYYTNEFTNIEHQLTTGVAAGYKIYDLADSKWDVFVGPSVQYTKFDQVSNGEKEDDSSPVLVVGTDYERDITDDIEYFFSYNAKFVSTDSGSIIHHLETGVEVEVINDFDIELTAIIDSVEDPIPNEDGVLPEATDVLFIVSLKYSF
ncbi:DUF481 domain-containing protein [Thalassotalea sp. ND16A]|uniref:DUF481 domain-containing protein n=1 Tax=Thalassotalea sp. ND16A TaxID=1535422 RepID=UPI00068C2AFF|nr:DUF481 domain-containing protein [Thalassotalea sp. ND16A]